MATNLDSKLGNNDRTLVLFEALFMFFVDRFRREACDDIKPTRYMTQHNRQMRIMLGKHVMQAMRSQ